MAGTTLYVGPNAATYASADVGTTLSASAGPASGVSVYAIGDGEQKLKFFYSSQANGIALPTLVAPNVVPTNFIQLGGTAGVLYALQASGSDYGTGGTTPTGLGAILATLSFSAGSPDAASPFQFVLDQSAIIIVSDLVYQGA